MLNATGERLARELGLEETALGAAVTTNADLAVLLRALAHDPNGMCPAVGKLAARVVMGMARMAALCNEDLEKAVESEVGKLLG